MNVGAAGTFVVRKPGVPAAFRAALLRRVPFVTEVVLCEAEALVRLATSNPFGPDPASSDLVRFVSFLPKALGAVPALPLMIPATGPWFVRVVALREQLAIGEYRRHMKTIGYLGQLDAQLGVRATTRSWNTVTAIVRAVEGESCG
jgi:uncharacterized protein (DUF1697 family)